MLCISDGDGGGCQIFQGKKSYECARFNVISITRGLVGVQFPEQKRYVTLEWPPMVTSPLWLVLLMSWTGILYIFIVLF